MGQEVADAGAAEGREVGAGAEGGCEVVDQGAHIGAAGAGDFEGGGAFRRVDALKG